MKPLHWKRLLLRPSDTEDRVVWRSVNELPFDKEQFTQLFSARKAARKTMAPDEAGAGAKAASGIVRVLDPKRSNHVAIAARSLPPADTLVRAIKTLDSALISKDQLMKLRSLLPLDEEVSAIQAADDSIREAGEGGKLDAPERLLLALASVAAAAARCRVWYFTWTFREKLAAEKPKLELVSRALAQLRRSRGIPALLGLVLSLGNYLNGGNRQRGQADGFNFVTLSKLDGFKDSAGKMSLLRYIATFVVQAANKMGEGRAYSHPDLKHIARLPSEVPLIKEAKTVDLAEIESALQKIANELESTHTSANQVLRTADSSDPFHEKIPPFFSRAKFLLEDARGKFEETHNSFVDIRTYFSAPDDMSPTLFFQVFCDLVIPLDRYMKKAQKVIDDTHRKSVKGAAKGEVTPRTRKAAQVKRVGDMNRVLSDLKAGNMDAASIKQAHAALGGFRGKPGSNPLAKKSADGGGKAQLDALALRAKQRLAEKQRMADEAKRVDKAALNKYEAELGGVIARKKEGGPSDELADRLAKRRETEKDAIGSSFRQAKPPLAMNTEYGNGRSRKNSEAT